MLPVCEPGFRPCDVDGQIRAWVTSPPMRALVDSFGGTLPDDDVFSWLEEFSAKHWDFRALGHVERDQVRARPFEPGETELIVAAATALGLVEPERPPRSTYDHLLVLGGLGRACLQRAEYAAELLRTGTVTVPSVAALGSLRPLTAGETALEPLAGLAHEVEAMDAAVRLAFGPDAHLQEIRSGIRSAHALHRALR